jgi:hypothetical protein
LFILISEEMKRVILFVVAYHAKALFSMDIVAPFQPCYMLVFLQQQRIGKGDHHVWGHHPAPKWSFREEMKTMNPK